MRILEEKKISNRIRHDITTGKKVCTRCTGTINSNNVCKDCKNTLYISAKQRLEQISDNNSFKELKFIKINNVDFSKKFGYFEKKNKVMLETGLSEAIIVGTCKIDGEKVILGIMDSKFLMGTLSFEIGEIITKSFEYAIKKNLPVILFCASGGARIQEGIFSLVQMAKINAVIKKHSEKGLLYISCLTNPTMGGVTASFGLNADINIAEKNSQIGFAGKKVVENMYKVKLSNDFQTENFYCDNGMIDIILDREEIKKYIGKLLKIFNKNKNIESKKNNRNINLNTTTNVNNVSVNKNYKIKSKKSSEVLENVRSIKRFKGKDYLLSIFDDYIELKGDRISSNDNSVICGLGIIDTKPFIFNIQNKGRNLIENQESNFGLTTPFGYRKIIRIANIAQKFKIPIINFIDTPGADASEFAEKNGQSVAISNCLTLFLDLKTIIISIIIGEGSSGGALALSISDKLGMLENALYCVISPESYLKISKEKNVKIEELLNSMRFTSDCLLNDKFIDSIINENDSLDFNTKNIKKFILDSYNELKEYEIKSLIKNRYSRIRNWDKKIKGNEIL